MIETNSTLLDEGASFVLNPLFSRVILAVFILLLGFIAGRVFGLLLKRFLYDIQADRHIRGWGLKFSAERVLGNVVSFVIYVATLILTLNTLGLTSTIVMVLLVGVVFIILVSFLLAVKDFFPNLFSGVRLKISNAFEEGDEVQIREVKGIISSVGLLETRIKTKYDEELIIPNALFIKRKILVKKKKQKR